VSDADVHHELRVGTAGGGWIIGSVLEEEPNCGCPTCSCPKDWMVVTSHYNRDGRCVMSSSFGARDLQDGIAAMHRELDRWVAWHETEKGARW